MELQSKSEMRMADLTLINLNRKIRAKGIAEIQGTFT
jgi:hypothetical protein